MGKSGSCPGVSSEWTQADPLHKLSYLILLVHGYIFVLFFLKITKCNGKIWLLVLMFRLNVHMLTLCINYCI